MPSEEKINKALEKLERDFQVKRKALMLQKREARREAGKKKKRRAPRILKREGRSKREIGREMVAEAKGAFTLTTMMAGAVESGNEERMSLTSTHWSSVLLHLKKIKHVEMLEPAVGNKPAVYRVCVPKEELLKERKVGGRKPSPLKNAILEAFPKMGGELFERTDLYAFLCESSPGFGEKFHLDSVGAVLNRLARRSEGVRIAEVRNSGNLYARVG